MGIRTNGQLGATLAVLTFGLPGAIAATQLPPVPANPQTAQTSLGFNINGRCPDLRIADGGPRTVVVFWVPKRGVQSQASIKTSSGSEELDAAALSCVGKLRFAPAVTLGDGESVDSWQQIALGWVDPDGIRASRAAVSPIPPAARTAQPAATPPAEPRASAKSSVTVHVCADAMGALTHEPTVVQSSGVDTLDQAALKIAAAGAPYYRPATGAGVPGTSGCAQLVIRFDAR